MTPVQLPEVPVPNWCRTCGRNRADPNAVLCLDPCHRHSPNRSRTVSADILERLDFMLISRRSDEDAIIRDARAEIVRLRGEVCSCPSGDGSLRWPCKAHPPEAIALAEAKGDECPNCVSPWKCNGPHVGEAPDHGYDTPQPADGGAVATVCLVPELRLPHFASVEVQMHDGYAPKIGDKLYTTPQVAQVQQEADWPMTDAEVRQWIGACNHEPARQVLRDYLQLRTTHPTGDALGAVRDAIKKARNIADGASACSAQGPQHQAGMRRACNIIEAALQHRGDSRGGEGSGG